MIGVMDEVMSMCGRFSCASFYVNLESGIFNAMLPTRSFVFENRNEQLCLPTMFWANHIVSTSLKNGYSNLHSKFLFVLVLVGP